MNENHHDLGVLWLKKHLVFIVLEEIAVKQLLVVAEVHLAIQIVLKPHQSTDRRGSSSYKSFASSNVEKASTIEASLTAVEVDESRI